MPIRPWRSRPLLHLASSLAHLIASPPPCPQRVSPSAEMVMIDRMFIQEEKTTLALDKQLAKEKPGR